MATHEELNEQLDKVKRLSDERMAERKALLDAARYVLEELVQVYDVSIEEGRRQESPFNGAGECIRRLREAIAKCEEV